MSKIRNILIVDDTKFSRNILVDIINNKPNYIVFEYRAIEARNGKEALEIISKENIDAILLDINMPIMNGFEVLKKLKEQNNNIAVIVITGDRSKKVENFKESKIVNLYYKPFSVEKLWTDIAEITEELIWRSNDEERVVENNNIEKKHSIFEKETNKVEYQNYENNVKVEKQNKRDGNNDGNNHLKELPNKNENKEVKTEFKNKVNEIKSVDTKKEKLKEDDKKEINGGKHEKNVIQEKRVQENNKNPVANNKNPVESNKNPIENNKNPVESNKNPVGKGNDKKFSNINNIKNLKNRINEQKKDSLSKPTENLSAPNKKVEGKNLENKVVEQKPIENKVKKNVPKNVDDVLLDINQHSVEDDLTLEGGVDLDLMKDEIDLDIKEDEELDLMEDEMELDINIEDDIELVIEDDEGPDLMEDEMELDINIEDDIELVIEDDEELDLMEDGMELDIEEDEELNLMEDEMELDLNIEDDIELVIEEDLKNENKESNDDFLFEDDYNKLDDDLITPSPLNSEIINNDGLYKFTPMSIEELVDGIDTAYLKDIANLPIENEEFIESLDDEKLIATLANAKKSKYDEKINLNEEENFEGEEYYQQKISKIEKNKEDDIVFLMDDELIDDVVEVDVDYSDDIVDILPPMGEKIEKVEEEKSKRKKKGIMGRFR